VLRGEDNSAQVMKKIAIAVTAHINAKAMLRLSESNHQLKSLSLHSLLDAQAYEALALLGGRVTELKLHSKRQTDVVVGFSLSPPLDDPCFKQQLQRKYPMKALVCQGVALDVKSFAKFLSCIGMIQALSIVLHSSQLPADIHVDMCDELPVYHAWQGRVDAPTGVDVDRIDNVFLAMTACQSSKSTNRPFPDASSSISLDTFMCKVRWILLQKLYLPMQIDLSPLNQPLIAELKLHDRGSYMFL
jgi:hypothetical protein